MTERRRPGGWPGGVPRRRPVNAGEDAGAPIA